MPELGGLRFQVVKGLGFLGVQGSIGFKANPKAPCSDVVYT